MWIAGLLFVGACSGGKDPLESDSDSVVKTYIFPDDFTNDLVGKEVTLKNAMFVSSTYKGSATGNITLSSQVLRTPTDKVMPGTSDYKKALELFENSAANEYEKAYSNIGYIYSYGLGVKQDKEKSQEFYKKANEILNKNHIKLIEEQSKHLFLGNTSKLIDSSNKSNFLTISNNIKDRLDINLYFMTSLDNNISNDLTNIQQQEALKNIMNI